MYGGRWFEKMGVELQDKDLSPLYIFRWTLKYELCASKHLSR